MASIDDIWDAPVTPSSPKTPRNLDSDEDEVEVQRPSKRQRQALFLSDSEDEVGGGSKRVRRNIVKAPPPVTNSGMEDDVEAMFADAENDEGLSFKRIDDLDVAAMEREAEERHRRPLPPTPHLTVPSNGHDDTTTGNNGKEENKGTKKRTRPAPLNENLLLGSVGFPDLISQVKDFKVKGKGREVEDLTRLMRIYNFWTHKLHPKLKFRDTVERIEKVCHSKRMQVALSVWRDESKGKTLELHADLSLDSDEEGLNNITSPNGLTQPFGNLSSGVSPAPVPIPPGPDTNWDYISLPPSSRASSQLPTSDFPEDDDFFGSSTSNRRSNATSTSTLTATKTRILVDDEEESLWKELEMNKAPRLVQSKSQHDLEEADMWASLEQATRQPFTTLNPGNAHAVSHPTRDMEINDDEMWDIIRENERVSTHQPPTIDSTTLAAETTTNSIKQPSSGEQSLAESEMDWDDMYAN